MLKSKHSPKQPQGAQARICILTMSTPVAGQSGIATNGASDASEEHTMSVPTGLEFGRLLIPGMYEPNKFCKRATTTRVICTTGTMAAGGDRQ